jgi:hypothetical protein
MKIDREQRMKAIKELLEDCKRFWAQADTSTATVPELISSFLESTDSTLEEPVRLIGFAGNLQRLGWNGVCEVYEYILARDPELSGTYGTWIMVGMAVMKDAESFDLEERVRVAEEVEAIIERARRDTEGSFEGILGHFYYDHPLRSMEPQQYLLKSKEFFLRDIEESGEDDCNYHQFQYLGDVLFELGDFDSALHWYERYEKFAMVEHQCSGECATDRALAHERIDECRQRLTKS